MRRKAKGFTLVELLVVVSIIALLMAMLVPALGRARQQARNAALKSALNAISTGLEQFRGEYGYYPSSERRQAVEINSEKQFAGTVDTGAHRLAEAMLGLDMQGYDETGDYDAAVTASARSSFLDVEKIGIVNLRIDRNRIGSTNWNEDKAREAFSKHDVGVDSDAVRLNLNPMLVDNISSPSKSRPILYWRASRRGRAIGQIYNRDDNADILNDTIVEDVLKHPAMAGATDPGGDPAPGDVSRYFAPTLNTAGTFEYHVWNPATSASAWSSPDGPTFTPVQPAEPYGKPYNPDSFLLICAGPDGEYGTKDDISNFEQNPKPEVVLGP